MPANAALDPTPARRLAWRAYGVLAVATCALAGLSFERRDLLLNITPSEPMGLYVRSDEPPARGRMIVFPAPAAAFPYADGPLGYLHRVPLLKAVAAGPGQMVCATGRDVRIDDRALGVIAEVDRQGRVLPHWRACRRLKSDELFALADRVPNSFDSRYFGPVPTVSLLGVFRPLYVFEKGRR